MARQAQENIQENLTDGAVTIKQENWPNWDCSDKTQVLKKEQDFEKSFTKEESAAVDHVTNHEKTDCDFDPSKVKSERSSPEPESLAFVDVTEVHSSDRNGFSKNSNIQNEPGNLGTDISGHVSLCQIGRDGNIEGQSPVNCCCLPVSQCELLERNVDENMVDDVNNSRENSEDKQKNHASCNTQTESKTSHQSEEKESKFWNFILTSTQDNEIISNENCSEIFNTETNGHRRRQNIESDACNVGITSLSYVQLLLKCDDCGKKVICFSHLRRHIKSHLEINESITSYETHNTTTNKHRKGCRRKRSYKCDTCNADLSSLSCLRSHLDTHRSGKLYRCEDCGKKYTYFSRLKKHISRHLKKQMSRTNNLGSLFSAESMLQRRRLKRNCEACYNCDMCSLTFSSRSCLVRHMRKHTQDETYTSNIGSADYFSKNVISKRKLADIVDETYVCDLCSAIFTNNSNLRRHKKLHTKPKSFMCDLCGLGFTYNYNLIEHKRIHTGEKPYTCHTCSASFSSKSNLNRHKKVHITEKPHMTEKPFLCDVCGAAFTWHVHLREHERTHTGEKPYMCDICGVKFAAHGHLKKHRVIHTGERNYKCGTCGKRFCRQTNLRSHERIHNRK